jgi:hypothetical protein
MALRFTYQFYPTRHPVITLGGAGRRPKPVLTAGVVGPITARAVEGLLDTGADDTVFPESVATDIGLDLSTAPSGSASGIGGAAVPVRYAEVRLRLSSGADQCEWRAWVAFTPVRHRWALFGFAGFLQFFTATFHGDREEVELTANALLPPP